MVIGSLMYCGISMNVENEGGKRLVIRTDARLKNNGQKRKKNREWVMYAPAP